jgi:hypothetical protein
MFSSSPNRWNTPDVFAKAFESLELGVTVFVPFKVDLVSDEPKCQESDFDAGASEG